MNPLLVGFAVSDVTTSGLTITGPNAAQLNPYQVVNIIIDQLGTSANKPTALLPSTFTVPLTGGLIVANSFIFPYDMRIPTRKDIILKQISVKLTDLQGNVINLNNYDWAFKATCFVNSKANKRSRKEFEDSE